MLFAHIDTGYLPLVYNSTASTCNLGSSSTNNLSILSSISLYPLTTSAYKVNYIISKNVFIYQFIITVKYLVDLSHLVTLINSSLYYLSLIYQLCPFHQNIVIHKLCYLLTFFLSFLY